MRKTRTLRALIVASAAAMAVAAVGCEVDNDVETDPPDNGIEDPVDPDDNGLDDGLDDDGLDDDGLDDDGLDDDGLDDDGLDDDLDDDDDLG